MMTAVSAFASGSLNEGSDNPEEDNSRVEDDAALVFVKLERLLTLDRANTSMRATDICLLWPFGNGPPSTIEEDAASSNREAKRAIVMDSWVAK